MAPDEFEQARQLVEKFVVANPNVAPPDIQDIIKTIMGQVSGYGPLQPFFVGEHASEVTEVMVNPGRYGPKVFYGRKGRLWPVNKQLFESDKKVKEYVQTICHYSGREFLDDQPIVDAWLKDGSRLAAMGFKASPLGTAFTIRKSPLVRPPMPLYRLAEYEMFPAPIARFIVDVVINGHANFGVFGRTDSGKTTVLRAIGNHFNPAERVIVGETSFELSFPHLPNLINLVEVIFGEKEIVNMTTICKAILRNNPDRAVVGEIRGKEIVAASQIAASTSGGFCTTGHAGDVFELCSRLPKMYDEAGVKLPMEYVPTELASMFNFLFFFDKADDGTRVLMSVVEVTKSTEQPFNVIYRFDESEYAATGGKATQWIHENPVTEKMLARLMFRGAKNTAEYAGVKNRVLRCDPDDTEQFKKDYGHHARMPAEKDDFLEKLGLN